MNGRHRLNLLLLLLSVNLFLRSASSSYSESEKKLVDPKSIVPTPIFYEHSTDDEEEEISEFNGMVGKKLFPGSPRQRGVAKPQSSIVSVIFPSPSSLNPIEELSRESSTLSHTPLISPPYDPIQSPASSQSSQCREDSIRSQTPSPSRSGINITDSPAQFQPVKEVDNEQNAPRTPKKHRKKRKSSPRNIQVPSPRIKHSTSPRTTHAKSPRPSSRLASPVPITSGHEGSSAKVLIADKVDPKSPNPNVNLREHLVLIQKALLVTAGATFVGIILYSIYYINMIRGIYAKERISE